ncbi:hypothetical protein SAMN05216553_110259 [Lentzea fradiae]|uniref:Uncharacterized protein n=1 Tax=Lentzea fradiae TaxID=200378 RepID=A0A1G7WAI1_9PSEU|nr:hypothetical protein [Lentzea fradiae]SDG68996.1 hypothetical protein SAMN05216553_110259 [Lentzea fradiae]
MIDQLPEHRRLPDDVRLRARRRLSEGLRPAPRSGRAVLIAAGVVLLAAGAVAAGQALTAGPAQVAGPSYPHNGELTGEDRAAVNHVERGTVAPDVLARCVAAAQGHPPAAEWNPIATSHNNGTALTAFSASTGMFFCATTATTTTVSTPEPVTSQDGPRGVRVLFTSPTGAIAGLVSPDVSFLSLTRISDSSRNSASPAVVDGLFLAPSAFLRAETGTRALVNGHQQVLRGVPKPSESVVDRPLPPAARDTPDATRFGECLRDRPIPDADQFAHTLSVQLSATDTARVGRFGDLLLYCLDTPNAPLRGTVYDLDDLKEIRGGTIASMAAFHDFLSTTSPEGVQHGGSGAFAAVGLVTDERVASITYTVPGAPGISATIAGGTFVLDAPLIDEHPDAKVVVRDAAGTVLETITPKRR